jgi:hypothetical protein
MRYCMQRKLDADYFSHNLTKLCMAKLKPNFS